jgi:hypothetical protein
LSYETDTNVADQHLAEAEVFAVQVELDHEQHHDHIDHEHDHLLETVHEKHTIDLKEAHVCSPDCPEHSHKHEHTHVGHTIELKSARRVYGADCPEHGHVHAHETHEHQHEHRHNIEHKTHICGADCPEHNHAHAEHQHQHEHSIEHKTHVCGPDCPEHGREIQHLHEAAAISEAYEQAKLLARQSLEATNREDSQDRKPLTRSVTTNPSKNSTDKEVAAMVSVDEKQNKEQIVVTKSNDSDSQVKEPTFQKLEVAFVESIKTKRTTKIQDTASPNISEAAKLKIAMDTSNVPKNPAEPSASKIEIEQPVVETVNETQQPETTSANILPKPDTSPHSGRPEEETTIIEEAVYEGAALFDPEDGSVDRASDVTEIIIFEHEDEKNTSSMPEINEPQSVDEDQDRENFAEPSQIQEDQKLHDHEVIDAYAAQLLQILEKKLNTNDNVKKNELVKIIEKIQHEWLTEPHAEKNILQKQKEIIRLLQLLGFENPTEIFQAYFHTYGPALLAPMLTRLFELLNRGNSQESLPLRSFAGYLGPTNKSIRLGKIVLLILMAKSHLIPKKVLSA